MASEDGLASMDLVSYLVSLIVVLVCVFSFL
jgi:hypothetical protein